MGPLRSALLASLEPRPRPRHLCLYTSITLLWAIRCVVARLPSAALSFVSLAFLRDTCFSSDFNLRRIFNDRANLVILVILLVYFLNLYRGILKLIYTSFIGTLHEFAMVLNNK